MSRQRPQRPPWWVGAALAAALLAPTGARAQEPPPAPEEAPARPPRAEPGPESPQELRALLAEARLRWDDGDIDGARALYERLLSMNPDLAWLHLEYGQALSAQGRFLDARPHLELAARLDPLNLDARLDAALCMDLLGDIDAAAKMYDRVLMLDPAHEKARFRLGRIQYERRDLNAAEATYRELLARNPKHWKALNNLGMVLLERHEPAASLTPLRRALKLRPLDPGVTYNLGRAHLALREPDRALKLFDRALSLWGANDVAAVRLHFDRGNALSQLGQLQPAAAAFEYALTLDPAYAPARLNLGAVLASLGRHDEAIAHLELASDYDNERASLYNEIALRYLEDNELDAAMTSLQKARALDNSNPQTFFLLSRLYKARGDLLASHEARLRACHLGHRLACEP
jgi:tetratricopeptide (TPR) repeat protein